MEFNVVFPNFADEKVPHPSTGPSAIDRRGGPVRACKLTLGLAHGVEMTELQAFSKSMPNYNHQNRDTICGISLCKTLFNHTCLVADLTLHHLHHTNKNSGQRIKQAI